MVEWSYEASQGVHQMYTVKPFNRHLVEKVYRNIDGSLMAQTH